MSRIELTTQVKGVLPTVNGGATGTNTGDQTSIVGIAGTLAQFDTACTDANFLSVAAAAAAYQPLAAVLTGTTASFTAAQEAKLAGIAAGATANSSDAFLLARANHTGTQAAATISDFDAATRAQTEAELIAGANITITPAGAGATRTLTIAASSGVSDGDKGDITVSGGGTAWTVDSGAITLAKQADMATGSLIYRKTAGNGAPEVQTLATLKTDLGLTGTNTGDQTSIVGITGTLAQFDAAVTDADILSVATAASTYQPLDTQLTDLAGLAYASNALKVVRVNAGATAWELVTLAGGDLLAANNLSDVASTATARTNLGLGTGGSPEFTAVNIGAATDTTLARAAAGRITVEGRGLVRGPASATDNAIARFDAATGDLAQNSAATVSDDGIIRSAINSGANPVSVPLCNWIMLTADYSLSNVATEQKAFNTTTNGELTLPAGVYEFECFLYILAMSATSGNAAFDPIGAGTAVADRFGYAIVGIDNASPLNAGTLTGSASVTQQSVASAVTAGTAVGMRMTARGMFRISTGGTIIPSITLVTANAATMKAGSYFMIKKIGETGETSLGAWT